MNELCKLHTAVEELREETQEIERCWKDECGVQITSLLFSALEDLQADVIKLEEDGRKLCMEQMTASGRTMQNVLELPETVMQ